MYTLELIRNGYELNEYEMMARIAESEPSDTPRYKIALALAAGDRVSVDLLA